LFLQPLEFVEFWRRGLLEPGLAAQLPQPRRPLFGRQTLPPFLGRIR
jgi:hypothetical protein